MAHISLDEAGKFRGRKLLESTRKMTVEFSAIDDHLAAMVQMLTGASSTADSFAVVADLYGVEGADQSAKNASAKILFDELNSASGNSAALRQILAILG